MFWSEFWETLKKTRKGEKSDFQSGEVEREEVQELVGIWDHRCQNLICYSVREVVDPDDKTASRVGRKNHSLDLSIKISICGMDPDERTNLVVGI